MKLQRLFTIAITILSLQAWSQNKDFDHGLGIHLGTMQYNGELGNEFYSFDNLHWGLGVDYTGYIDKNFDFNLLFAHGLINHRKHLITYSRHGTPPLFSHLQHDRSLCTQ